MLNSLRRLWFVALAGGLAFVIVNAQAAAQQPGKELPPEAKKAKEHVDTFLKGLNARGARVTHVADPAVAQVLPGYQFFAVLFPLYPVGMAPPKGLRASNVVAVSGDGKVHPLIDGNALQVFFRDHVGAVKEAPTAEKAAHAWLRLSQELHQDGFYKFTIGAMTVKQPTTKETLTVSGTASVVPEGGNKGEIQATLTFDKAGKFITAAEQAKLMPGIRPICQATKLLDPDPLVRRMAEQDLLVMGQMAFEYLTEQRAQATSELQRAIDRIRQRILDEGR
jgi:hypothetical protein